MRVECIVMDDDSNDRTAEIAREMGAKVYNVTYDNNGNTWIGKSYACYLGALIQYQIFLYLWMQT